MSPELDVEPSAAPRKFDSARVVFFESRNAKEMARLIEKQNGQPLAAPSLREVPLTDQHEALELGERLFKGEIDVLVLLTGVGLRALMDALATRYERADVVERLKGIQLICRGPKPVLVLKELGLVPSWVAPEPNTSDSLLAFLDASGVSIDGKRVEIQEYGERNVALLRALEARGAKVRSVAVYMWQLPEDTEPLKNAVRAMTAGEADVAFFTSARQVVHLYQIAAQLGLDEALQAALTERVVVASIGPVTSDALRAQGIAPDIEPPHAKMGAFVTHVAAEWIGLRAKARSSAF
jgi:uroporphyrinogen-III synthase